MKTFKEQIERIFEIANKLDASLKLYPMGYDYSDEELGIENVPNLDEINENITELQNLLIELKNESKH